MPSEILSAKALESKLKEASRRAVERNTRIEISDGNNLLLVVRPNGGASWVLKYRLHGKRNMHALGAWPTIGLSHARKLADVARRKVADGVDPVEAKREARVEAARKTEGDTVLHLMDQWLEKMTVAAVYEGNIRAAMHSNVLPEIGAMRVADVKRTDVLKILRKIEARGSLVTLRKVRMWTRQMFEFELGKERPGIDSNPVPSGRLTAFKAAEKGHFAAITNVADVPALMRAIHGWVRPLPRMALLMSAHTFQRPSEVREAAWNEFDLAASRWVIPAERTKMRQEHWVPLSKQMVALLQRHQGLVGNHGLLFPSRIDGKPLSEMTINKALKSMGYHERHTTHGFRAMARTILDEHLKVDVRFIEKQLSHEIDRALGGAYNRAQYWDDRVKMMAAWSSWLDAQSSDR